MQAQLNIAIAAVARQLAFQFTDFLSGCGEGQVTAMPLLPNRMAQRLGRKS